MAVHSSAGIGIIALFKNRIPAELAEELQHLNRDAELLRTQFRFPGGSKIEYEVNAPKNKWVIRAVNGIAQDRLFDKWPLVSGDFKPNDALVPQPFQQFNHQQ